MYLEIQDFLWKRRAPKNDEDPSTKFLEILNMGSIFEVIFSRSSLRSRKGVARDWGLLVPLLVLYKKNHTTVSP